MENRHAESNYLEGFSTNELSYPIANNELRLRKILIKLVTELKCKRKFLHKCFRPQILKFSVFGEAEFPLLK